MYAKSILLVGQPDGAYRRAIGFPIEIVPEADPYAIKSGESLPVQIGRAFGRRSRLKSPKTQPDERRICQINGNRRLRGNIASTCRRGYTSEALSKRHRWSRWEEYVMRMTVFAFCLILSIAGTAAAQEWDLYVSARDGFKVDFPGQPKVTETTWKSQLDYTLPGACLQRRQRTGALFADRGGLQRHRTTRDRTSENFVRPATSNAGKRRPRHRPGILEAG